MIVGPRMNRAGLGEEADPKERDRDGSVSAPNPWPASWQAWLSSSGGIRPAGLTWTDVHRLGPVQLKRMAAPQACKAAGKVGAAASRLPVQGVQVPRQSRPSFSTSSTSALSRSASACTTFSSIEVAKRNTHCPPLRVRVPTRRPR